MKNLKKTAIALTTLSAITLSSGISAKLFDSDFLEVDGLTQLDYTNADADADEHEGNLDLRANVTLTANISDQVRAVLGLELRQRLMDQGVDADSIDFDLEEFIKEAYIEIRNVAGQPVAFIVGKHQMAFGQNFSAMSMTDEGSSAVLGDLTRVDEVFGVTMRLNTNFFGLIDSVELSAFENEAGDLDIGDMDNFSVRMNSQITDQISASASYMNRNDGTDGDREHRASLGFIYDDGTWTAYVEGVGMVNNAKHPDSDWAATVGVSRDMGFGRVSVEYNYIQNSLHQIGVGFQTEITDGLTIGPQVDYIQREGEDDGEIVAGVRMRYTHSNKAPERKTDTILNR